jgi:hypothetical protein
MLDDLITLPIRLGLRATSIAVRTGLQATERTISFASFVVRSATGGRASAPAPMSAPSERSRSARRPGHNGASAEEPASGTRLPPRPDTPTIDLDADPAPLTGRPDHVSEEPQVVEEFAEPGAEEGAGAEVHFVDPWEGYAEMSAKQVIARVSSASVAELAMVQLYESAHKARETVLTAVERRLRSTSGRATEVNPTTKEQPADGG